MEKELDYLASAVENPKRDVPIACLFGTLGAGVEQQVFGGWSVGLSGGYDSIDYVQLQTGASNNRSDGYFSLQANVDYDMNRHLKARLFYIRRQDDSTVETFTYANNMVGIQVAWRF